VVDEVVASEFVALDGVMGSPESWQLPYFDDEMGEAVGATMAAADAMLMGRVTYDHGQGVARSVSLKHRLRAGRGGLVQGSM